MKKAGRYAVPAGTKLPDHVAIIPDGDRRWARAKGRSAMEGHMAGMKRMVEVARAAREMGIHTMSAWGLSTENWLERPKVEVDFLFRGISEQLRMHLAEAKRDGARIVHLGRKDRMPEWFLDELARAEEETRHLVKHVVNLGLDYNGRDELIRATNKCIDSKLQTPNSKFQITKEDIEAHLDTAGQPYPYPDLIIRTSGEQRTSGMLMWQSEYAEFYFEQENFPEFTVERFVEALLDYSRRRRRFGGNDSGRHFEFRPEVVARFELKWWRLEGKLKDMGGEGAVGVIVDHLKELFGLSKGLAAQTAGYMVEAVREKRRGEWEKVKESMVKFYGLVKEEVGYAFEPRLVAGLEVRWMRETDSVVEAESGLSGAEEAAKRLYAEVYRISLLQAAKAARLRALAAIERRLAISGAGNTAAHWARAEDYLVKFYRALKERVA